MGRVTVPLMHSVMHAVPGALEAPCASVLKKRARTENLARQAPEGIDCPSIQDYACLRTDAASGVA